MCLATTHLALGRDLPQSSTLRDAGYSGLARHPARPHISGSSGRPAQPCNRIFEPCVLHEPTDRAAGGAK